MARPTDRRDDPAALPFDVEITHVAVGGTAARGADALFRARFEDRFEGLEIIGLTGAADAVMKEIFRSRRTLALRSRGLIRRASVRNTRIQRVSPPFTMVFMRCPPKSLGRSRKAEEIRHRVALWRWDRPAP